ncbi:SHR3 [Candida jiufengensis]|uniref:SHR3 n=1 Tax=Candida jiufengensis TaxID=497108 RepID=UPI0022258099|nr:SHR3 [Candida jiufengensis]KAI5955236.1 SHR3 [Candida jiufengensis]
MMKYKDIVPIGTVLITSATSFGLGLIYSNWPYDLNTLWRHNDPNGLSKSLVHYQTWGESPMYIHYTLHAIAFIGLIGHFIKLYKPDEEAKYFEYGSLGLFMISIIIYLTNLRTGVNSCITGEWGDVDFGTGINVMAASQVMILLALIGVLVLQGGLYYAQWYDEQLKIEFYENEAREAAAAAEKQAKQEEELASGGNKAEVVDVEIEDDSTATATKGKKKSIKKRKS